MEELTKSHSYNILEQVVSAAQSLPSTSDLSLIRKEAALASDRGYYLPDEDERLRLIYSDYLRIRLILLESIHSLTNLSQSPKDWSQNLENFAIAYSAASSLLKASNYIIETAQSSPVIWNKLDEEEKRFGIKRKSLTQLYKSSTSPLRMWQFYEATQFLQANYDQIIDLKSKGSLHAELINLLELHATQKDLKKRLLIKQRLKYRLYSMIRRHQSGYHKAMFHLFRLTGSAIAEMKQPFRKEASSVGKQVNSEIIQQIQTILKPGDIIITRHNDALTNLFLPGYWPHAAFYAGGEDVNKVIIESKKDGVKFRPLRETLAVDSFLVLRSDLSPSIIQKVIATATTHVGKRYDFLFDFTKANRLACTELVYRAFQATSDIRFHLNERAGRQCLSAEDLIDQSIASKHFKCVALFGLSENKITFGDKATTLLKDSYNSQW